ncbi:Alkane hydroxylase MAH1 [Sesamum angolense]|uniref:Alkane hydroxylase MAH1 n=1 Tax=Sesamum angolense TaxID=2727404 RepID=A0AAE1W4Y0_9LAMI|nr:Alkane hydroxylase MAH1 [Sesamum angolense]
MRSRTKSCEPTVWPLVGMLPAVVQYLHRGHDKVTEILCECGGTYWFRGPWFGNIDMLFTSDPANIQHIFSKNFSNYPKGSEFRKKFEILGDGIFSADYELWELQRRTTLALMNQAKFYSFLERNVWQKIQSGLLPVLDRFTRQGTDVDLQEIFQRFTFDNICQLVLDYDPCSLSTDLPYIPCEKAFSNALEPLFHRHLLPESIWKLQKWLNLGNERKLAEAWKAFDDFIYPLISSKEVERERDDSLNILTAFRKAYEENNHISFSGDLRQFLRDSMLGLLFAGRDTTSTCLTWLFWLISTNPSAQTQILEEIKRELHVKEGENWRFFGIEESSKLIYLHGALCESLRLFPPLALEYKSPVRPDTLPSGHHIRPNTKLIISFYSMGRMETIWGKDCLEFKPERWISGRGGIEHRPSNKFPAFNVGPRTCVGKEMSFAQMKMVAATIIYHYNIKLVESHPVTPRDSIILQAKYGLRVSLSKRDVI